MHDEIIARYILECTVETLEPLHIGSGKAIEFVSAIDNPIIKCNEVPVIPGSSIKGALRAHFTRLLNSVSDNVFNEFGLKKTDLGDFEDFEKFERTFSSESEDRKMELLSRLGTLEKFFGISGLASPLRITDAEPENINTGTRTHIKVNIGTDRVEEGRLFTVEYVEGKFKFKIVFDELSGEHYKDVNKFFHNIFVKSLARGLEIHLGGMRSRGYGLCLLKINRSYKFTPEKLILGEEPEKWVVEV